jgi:hypothetical protein
MAKEVTKSDNEAVATGSIDLEASFPDVASVFAPYLVGDINGSDALVALDTNVLLLPYEISQDDLQAIADVYAKLAKEDRLFLPSRVAREFAKHRERNPRPRKPRTVC